MPDTRLDDLLLRWEELRDAGQAVTPEQLCADTPELLDDLRKQIAALQAFDPVARFGQETAGAATGSDGRKETATGGDDDHADRRAGWPAVPGYEILGELGHGGMGAVYKARDNGLKRLVALKVILAGRMAPKSARTRFRAEAEAIARLADPHVVQVYAVGDAEGCPYIALEYVGGGTVADAIDVGGPVDGEVAAKVVEPLARAIDHAHQQGVIHRDLKPANILLAPQRGASGTPAGSTEAALPQPGHARLMLCAPKIADFGLARHLDAGERFTRSGAVLGTPAYMAPEQARGESKAIGPRTDIYGLGTILYELLTGRPPFDGENAFSVMRQVDREPPPPPRSINPHVPLPLERVCLRCLAKRPDDRYQTAGELAEDLRRFLAGERVRGPRFRPAGRTLTRRAALAASGLGGLAAAAGGWYWLGHKAVHDDAAVRLAASRVRARLSRDLLTRQQPTGWFGEQVGTPERPVPDVWAHAHAAYAVLSTPEAPVVPVAARDWLRLPFEPGRLVEANGRAYGWLASGTPEPDVTTVEPAVTVGLMLAAAVDRPGLLTADDRTAAGERLTTVQRVLRTYRPEPFKGGWSLVPDQSRPSSADPPSTADVFQYLLYRPKAAAALDASALDRTAHWLATRFDGLAQPPGWRATDDPLDPILAGLSLQIYALLLEAEDLTGLTVPDSMAAAITAQLKECLTREADYPDAEATPTYTFTDHQGRSLTRLEPVSFYWYPWAVRMAVGWQARAVRRNDLLAANLARRVLGHLVVDQGEAHATRARDGRTQALAETLIGLTAIDAPG